MVEAAPTSALIMPEAEFLLELAIIPFDPPPHLGGGDQITQCGRLRQG